MFSSKNKLSEIVIEISNFYDGINLFDKNYYWKINNSKKIIVILFFFQFYFFKFILFYN